MGPDAGSPAVDGGARAAIAAVRSRAVYEVDVTEGLRYGQGLVRTAWDAVDGEVQDLSLDVYEPRDGPDGLRPALLLIHGGGFRTGSSEHAGIVAMANSFAARGWVSFAINYRKTGDFGTIPADWGEAPGGPNRQDGFNAMYTAGRDAKAALRWVHAQAERYRIDPARITAVGSSAGAVVAIMLGLSDPEDYRDELTVAEDPTLAQTQLEARADVAAVIDLWGTKGMLDLLRHRDGRNRFDGDDPPVLIIHGREDETVSFSAAEALLADCEAAGIATLFRPFDGGHGAWQVRIDGKTIGAISFRFLVDHLGLEVQ